MFAKVSSVGSVWTDWPDGLMVLLHFARVTRVFVFSQTGRTKTWATRVNSKKCHIRGQKRV